MRPQDYRLPEGYSVELLSQSQFGTQFGGYSQPQISAYESGDAVIPLGLLLAIREKERAERERRIHSEAAE